MFAERVLIARQTCRVPDKYSGSVFIDSYHLGMGTATDTEIRLLQLFSLKKHLRREGEVLKNVFNSWKKCVAEDDRVLPVYRFSVRLPWIVKCYLRPCQQMLPAVGVQV